MSYANDITGKLEDAAVAMLQAAVTAGTITLVASTSILPGVDDGDVPLPRVVCVCNQATVEEIFDGNWSAELEVDVIASASDYDREDFRALAGEIYAHFFLARSSVNTNLSNATVEFTAFDVYPRAQSKALVRGEEGNEWQSKLTLTVKCCGSVVA